MPAGKIRARVSRTDVLRQPHLAWNVFIDLLATTPAHELSQVQLVAHLAFWYDSEVQNGGHLQYFENRGVDQVDETLAALQVLGAHEQRKVLQRAAEIWATKARASPRTPEEHAASAREGVFEASDSEYFACSLEITALLEAYLQNHEEEFIIWVGELAEVRT